MQAKPEVATCGTCIYWCPIRPRAANHDLAAAAEAPTEGECRVSPPRMLNPLGPRTFPRTNVYDWCGEWDQEWDEPDPEGDQDAQ
jgi:hypothetical protein